MAPTLLPFGTRDLSVTHALVGGAAGVLAFAAVLLVSQEAPALVILPPPSRRFLTAAGAPSLSDSVTASSVRQPVTRRRAA